MTASSKTKLAYSEYLKMFPYNIQDVFDTLLCPERKIYPQAEFLKWLLSDDSAKTDHLVSEKGLARARGLLAELDAGFTYANQDCDWRSGVRTLIWNWIPVSIWCAYRNELAYRYKQENNIELTYG